MRRKADLFLWAGEYLTAGIRARGFFDGQTGLNANELAFADAPFVLTGPAKKARISGLKFSIRSVLPWGRHFSGTLKL